MKFFSLRREFFFFAFARRKKNEKKTRKKTYPALAGARLAAVDHVLHREVGHRERAGAAADVVAVGQGGGRGCFGEVCFSLSLEVSFFLDRSRSLSLSLLPLIQKKKNLSLTVGPARAAVLGDVLVAHGRELDGPGPPVVGRGEVLGGDRRERERGLAVVFFECERRQKRLSRSVVVVG